MKSKSYFNITPITFKLKCLSDIEGAITLPAKNFFVRNQTSMRICYSIDKKIKYIHLPSPEHVAQFLRKLGFIDSYVITGAEVHMYSKILITIPGQKGQPVQQERLVPIKWEDINLNKSQVSHYCAIHEFESKGKQMGIVVNMVKDSLKIA